MNVKQLIRIFARAMYGMVIVAMVLSVSTVVYAAPPSPVIGHWEAIDVDGSEMTLAIAGPPIGPFQITWTDDYIGYCSGEAGIVRGTASLNDNDPNLLEADVRLECFRSGTTLDFHGTLRYHPATNTLSIHWWFGQVTIWHRPGGGQVEEPPALVLRVNYGHDWVESFYEDGHTAWVTVTDGDGYLKATAELVAEPKWYWGDETGFQSLDGVWFDADGNQMEYPPDIQPYDWVFGWVDNGASAQVQIGEIGGTIDLANDSISGTIDASWFPEPVHVECLDWGSGQESPFDNKDGGFILTNGEDPYTCSWYGEWDIQPYQDVGVGYFGSDGHWVANTFFARNPRIVASEAGDWFWTTEFNPGMLNLFIYESAGEGSALLWSGQSEADQSGFTIVGYDIHGKDLVPGNYLVVSDGVNEKGLVLETITMEVFDTENEIMAGTAPAGRDVTVVAGMAEAETQATIYLTADAERGVWLADFSTIPFDITEEMRPWSFAQIFDEDGDANEAGTPPPPVTIFVTSTDDVVANDGDCTLREAIIAANTNAPSGDLDGECPAGLDNQTDSILLAANQTYSLTIDSTFEDGAMDGDLDIWDNSAAIDLIVMVEGYGIATISQDASVDDRVLENHGAALQIEGLTLTGGSNVEIGGGLANWGGIVTLTNSTVSGNSAGGGGGLANWGTATVTGSQITNNTVNWAGGGVSNSFDGTLVVDGSAISGNYSDVFGGGIMNSGTLTVNNSEIKANSTPVKGGGITNEGTLIVDHSVLSGNSAEQGGALYNPGTATIQNGSVIGGDSNAGEGNTATVGGGGVVNFGSLTMDGSNVSGNIAPYGAGLNNWGGVMTLTNSVVSSNSASAHGGGIINTDGGTIRIENNTLISENIAPSGGGIANWEKSSVTISNSTVSSNTGGGSGGGIANWGMLTVESSIIANNSANASEYSSGGGIVNWGGTVTLANSVLSENEATWGGGIVTYGGNLTVDASSVAGNTAQNDGGIQIKDGADVVVQNGSSISSNEAVGYVNPDTSELEGGYGGGVSNWGSSLTIDASFVTGNSAVASAGGVLNKDGGTTIIQNGSIVSGNTATYEGGISNWDSSTLTVDASTITDNTASRSSGGIGNLGTMTLNASIISGNSAPVGGGVFNNRGALTITGSMILSNTADYGGGILNVAGPLAVTDTALLGNTATVQGGAFYNYVDGFYEVSITDSCVVGNSDTAVFNDPDSAFLMNAADNWWGADSGPSGAGSGTGDSVSDNVDFYDWLTEPPSICAP